MSAGCAPGQQAGLEHLAWGGRGDAIHLHAGGISDGRMEYYGADTGTVSGPCQNDSDAQYAADAYLRRRVTEALAPAQDPARATSSWREEILRAAGDISPAIASRIRQAAEDAYRRGDGERGEARGRLNPTPRPRKPSSPAPRPTTTRKCRQPLRAYREAREQADRLIGDRDSPDWQKRVDAEVADHEAGRLEEAYVKTWMAARPRHDAEVRRAWREPDKDFVRSHLAELKAADPVRFNRITSARWLARISPPATSAGPGTALARTDSRPSQQVPRRRRGR